MTSALLRKRETMSAYLFVFERERESKKDRERGQVRERQRVSIDGAEGATVHCTLL